MSTKAMITSTPKGAVSDVRGRSPIRLHCERCRSIIGGSFFSCIAGTVKVFGFVGNEFNNIAIQNNGVSEPNKPDMEKVSPVPRVMTPKRGGMRPMPA